MAPVDILRLYRPLNAMMGGIGVIAGAIIASGTEVIESYWMHLILGYAVAVFFAGAGNALNDYFDAENDRINHPERPIPSGRVKRETALHLSAVSFILAFVLSIPLAMEALAIISCVIVLMILYEFRLKAMGFPGNMTISFITSASFLYGGAIVHNIHGTVIFFAMSFLSNLGREIIKDVEDMEGDIGRRTLPMRIGERKAIIVGAIFIIMAVAISPLPVVLVIYRGIEMMLYAVIVVLADGLFIHSIMVPFTHEDFRKTKRSSKEMKMAMLTGLMAFLGASLV